MLSDGNAKLWTGRKSSHLIDAGLGVEEEEFDGGIVLQVWDAFYIEPGREKLPMNHRSVNRSGSYRAFSESYELPWQRGLPIPTKEKGIIYCFHDAFSRENSALQVHVFIYLFIYLYFVAVPTACGNTPARAWTCTTAATQAVTTLGP